ncbi:MAG: circadian clock protein KaiB [Desulfamplus sp.]|nr:circadian clock protein KaiB [Desulfamplus sp.]
MKDKKYQFILFVANSQHNSVKAIFNIKQFCKNYLEDDYYLEIVDILNNHDLAVAKGVYITPMLIVDSHHPPSYMAGDLSDANKIKMELLTNK